MHRQWHHKPALEVRDAAGKCIGLRVSARASTPKVPNAQPRVLAHSREGFVELRRAEILAQI